MMNKNKKHLVYVEDVLEIMNDNRAYMSDVGIIHARNAVKEAPIIEAVELVHAHWNEKPNVETVDGERISNYECSSCFCWFRSKENYCGYCGAKMDET